MPDVRRRRRSGAAAPKTARSARRWRGGEARSPCVSLAAGGFHVHYASCEPARPPWLPRRSVGSARRLDIGRGGSSRSKHRPSGFNARSRAMAVCLLHRLCRSRTRRPEGGRPVHVRLCRGHQRRLDYHVSRSPRDEHQEVARLPQQQRASRISIDGDRIRHEAASGHAGEFPLSELTTRRSVLPASCSTSGVRSSSFRHVLFEGMRRRGGLRQPLADSQLAP